jgi:hypothetical protein
MMMLEALCVDGPSGLWQHSVLPLKRVFEIDRKNVVGWLELHGGCSQSYVACRYLDG